MKRPLKLRILGKQYTIGYVPAEHPEVNDAEDGPLHGRITHDKQYIYILEGLQLEQEQDTVLHEVVHGIEAAMGLSLEEDDVLRLSTGLLAVLKDNPSFARYLTQKAKLSTDGQLENAVQKA